MSGKNAYLQRLARDRRRWQAAQTPVHTQMCLDAAMIAANEVLQLGPGRVMAFRDAFSEALTEIAQLTVSDTKDMEFTKSRLDRRIASICGEHFRPWDERYGA